MKAKKVAVISDLHASLSMLDAFISYINKQDVELILNLGDYISNGPNPCEVFDRIWVDKRFINIKGYDEDSLFHSVKKSEGIAQGEWIRKKLGKDRLKKIELSPSIKMININNKKLLMCHINGWAEILQKSAHHIMGKLKDENYNYILMGGSHRPEMTYQNKIFLKGNVIDPGAMTSSENRGNFVILDFSQEEPNISFHSLYAEKIHSNQINSKEKRDIIKEEVEENTLKDTLLYIHGKKKSGEVYIDQDVVQRILEIGLEQSKYICIGCWSHEKQIIRELLYYLKCRKIKASEEGSQEWYIGEVTDQVRELVLNRRLLPCGRLKWFEISFQDHINSTAPLYSIYHYGKEGFIKRLSLKELYSMEEMLKKYDIPYTIPINQ